MSRGGYGSRDLTETFQEFLTGCAKVVMSLGGLATLASIGLLVFTCFRVGGADGSSQTADAIRNIEIFQKILLAGVLGLGVGASYLFWGEELLGAIQILLAGALYFSPLFLPSLIGGTSNDATKNAMSALQMGGSVLGIIGVFVLVVDIAIRIRQRAKTGVKADQLKYGKGIKEETEKQNVLMGKCWQLPFCRKFVRERCPIYLSKRTCWRELVGCMCEEQVIRGAMENKPIPKDAVLAANYIPQNHKLTMEQKRDRCKNCIIYNEHQRHKYKVWMPVTFVGFVLFYAAAHGLLISAVEGLVEKINHVVNIGTLGAAGKYQPPQLFVEMLLFVIMVIGLTYSMKMLEYLIFKLKV